MTSQPPVVLVKTWIKLLSSRDNDVKKRALSMLHRVFGDINQAKDFCAVNEIKFKTELWARLLESDDQQVRNHASKLLLDTHGSESAVKDFYSQNKILPPRTNKTIILTD